MKYMKLMITAIMGAFVMAACSTTTDVQDSGGRSSAGQSAEQAQINETPKTGLPAQKLDPGACGLFLWERRESPDFVFFSKGASEEALIWYEGETHSLTRMGVSGDVFGQFLTEQTYTMSGGRVVQLTMTPGDLLVGGQRVPEASMKVVDSEGWSTLIPVAGVTACQPGSLR